MKQSDNAAFISMLSTVFSTLNKPVPDQDALVMWFHKMMPYDLRVLRAAFDRWLDISGWPPTPADILQLLGTAPSNDGRPTAAEAWAIALTSNDEDSTVVWTSEISRAFAIALPLMRARMPPEYGKPVRDDGGMTRHEVFKDDTSGKADMFAARNAFTAAYDRFVAEARRESQPAKWVASLGRDVAMRTPVIEEAVTMGRLSYESAGVLLIGNSTKDEEVSPSAKENINRLMTMIATARRERAERAAEHGDHSFMHLLRVEEQCSIVKDNRPLVERMRAKVKPQFKPTEE